MRIPVSIALLFCGAGPALATREGGAAARLPGSEGLLTTVLGLALVLALIFAAAWVLKRFGGLPAGGQGSVRVLGGISLGARERLVVVEVEGTRLILGVAPGRVQTLHVLPPQKDFAASLEQARETHP